MSFTVEDFKDLIELLAQHPEWRAELRRHVLSEELLELPSVVRQLVEAQARTEAAIASLAAAQERTEVRLERVDTRLDGIDARLDGIDARLDGIDTRLARIDDRLGELDGDALEQRYARRAPTYFNSIARRLRVIEDGPLADLLDDAVEEGQLTGDERDAILRADLVLTGRSRPDGQDVYLLTEVSVGVGVHDVERAFERARLLEKLGRPVLPIVAGDRINDEAARLAREQGVWYARRGHISPPRER
ncbi:MAG TPA: hypothetical protein VFH48_17160 [Chloroflexota bacterium]|nr:hypothetical protein [Chloroflexota bacterium]